MRNEQEQQAFERQERRIDEALKESFPASDPPSFIGAGSTNYKTLAVKPDIERVNIFEPDELQDWGCTLIELTDALQDVGAMPANVEAQLAAKGHKRS